MKNRKNSDEAPRREYTKEGMEEIRRLKEEILGLEIQNAFLKKKIELREKKEKEMRKRREESWLIAWMR